IFGSWRERSVEQPLPVAALAHRCAGRGVDDGPCAARLPATAHRLVEADQVLRDAALRRHELLLLAEERALRIEDSLEVDQALAEMHVGDVEGAPRFCHRFCEER